MLDKARLFKNFEEQRDLMEDKIQSGIEANRKGYARLNFVDGQGSPVSGVKVTIKQLTHDFKFGCNLFKYKCFPTAEENALYEEKFAKLFNLAVAPFYWGPFEPEEGKMRFEKDSVFIDRRPAPEAVLEFCRKHNLKVKGHPLFWPSIMPQWLPDDYAELKPYLTRRLERIAQRYDGAIQSFDCVNEVTSVQLRDREPDRSKTYQCYTALGGDYPQWAFKQADRFFADSELNINETGASWAVFNKELSPYFMLIERLLNLGCRVDRIGLQYHVFRRPDDIYDIVDSFYNPVHLYKVMDCYGKFQRPLSVSEITIPGYEDNGEEIQAETVKNLYRIWFSQRNADEIVYWNLGDNCAAVGDGWAEDQFQGGLLKNDFSEKLSYQVLDELINRQWRTNLEYESAGQFLYFKGFYGEYEVTAGRGEKEVTRKIHLSKQGYDEFQIQI